MLATLKKITFKSIYNHMFL